MCGIVGFVGTEQAAPILLNGLERLEYRGYDSAGIAVVSADKQLQVKKSKGRLKVLSDIINGGKSIEGTLGIGHTRWATHGEPNDINAHPHLSQDGKIAVVHNGIIENYVELRDFLRAKGYVAASDRDAWIHFDYVPGEPDIREGGAMVSGRVCVIGSKLNEEAVEELFGI